MARERDTIDRVVDVAFGLPIAGTALARDVTKLAAHQLLAAARDATARVALMAVDDQADSVEPFTEGGRSGSDPASNNEADEPDGASVDAGPMSANTLRDPSDADDLAIDGYEELGARQIIGLLESLDAQELAAIEDFERAKRARRTVLAKIAALQDQDPR